MVTQDLLGKLADLAQFDYDAVNVYDDVLGHVADDDVKTHFKDFRDEHEHHVTELSAAILRIFGQALEPTHVDAMGHVADWVTLFRSMMGEQGALHAMLTAEEYHNRKYADAVAWETEDSALQLTLERFREEEKRHLEFIESKLGVGVAVAR